MYASYTKSLTCEHVFILYNRVKILLPLFKQVIRAAKACEVEVSANKEVTTLNIADKVPPNDAEFDPHENSTNFPNMEDILGTNFLNDDYYFSDILNSFSSWDNFMTNYPATQPNISFDNLSDEDLLQVQV